MNMPLQQPFAQATRLALFVWWTLGLALFTPALGQPDTVPIPPTPPVTSEVIETPTPPTPPQRLDEVVQIGGDALVANHQIADGVVVIRGTAIIEGEVNGDVVVVLGKVTLLGSIRGDLVVVAGEADLQGDVRGDTFLILTRSKIGPEANLQGDLVGVGATPEIAPGAQVSGSPILVSFGPLMHYFDGFRDYLFEGILLLRPFPPGIGWVWAVAAVFLLFHVFIALLFAQPLRGCIQVLHDQPARSFLIGLLACLLIGPVSILLSFTVIATPLLWLAFLVLAMFGRITVYAGAGAALGRASGLSTLTHPVPALMVGSILFYLSYMVPILGFLVYWVVLPWGIGAVLIRLFDSMRTERRWDPPASVPLSPGSDPATPPPGSSSFPAASAATSPTTAASASAFAVPEPNPSGFTAETPLTTTTDTPPPASSHPPGPESTRTSPSSPPFISLPAMELAAAARVGFWPRFGATLLDLMVVGFINLMTFGESNSFWIYLALYHVAFWAWKGTTLGGSILGLKLVRLDGRAVDLSTAIVRALGSIVSLLPLGLGFLWVAWDDEVQSWHDRIAGTTMVRAPRRATLA